MKRTLERCATDVLRAYDTQSDLFGPMEALREAIAVEKLSASERARRSALRRLTPEQREQRIAKAERAIAELRAVES